MHELQKKLKEFQQLYCLNSKDLATILDVTASYICLIHTNNKISPFLKRKIDQLFLFLKLNPLKINLERSLTEKLNDYRHRKKEIIYTIKQDFINFLNNL